MRQSVSSPRRQVAVVAVVALFALGSGCQDTGVQAGADLRAIPDLRTGTGNAAIGVSCRSVEQPCPTDSKTGGAARCATILDFDQVGACAPGCVPENSMEVEDSFGRYLKYMDCDTVVEGAGDVRCARMTDGNKYECVIFCDAKKRLGRECPVGWGCVPMGGFKLCRPSQDPPDMK